MKTSIPADPNGVKFEAHRRPGDMHVHFFGADAFSFGEGIRLEANDVMQVSFDGFGRPLRNPLQRISGAERLIQVGTLTAERIKTRAKASSTLPGYDGILK